MHAYGEAIDVNDVQNPYTDGATVIPSAGSSYLDRSAVRPGMAVPGGIVVDVELTPGACRECGPSFLESSTG